MHAPDCLLVTRSLPAQRGAGPAEAASEIALHGHLDRASAPVARRALEGAVRAGAAREDEEVAVSLSGVTVVDLVGVGVLVGAHHHAERAGVRVRFVQVPAGVLRALLRTRVDRVLHISA